MVKRSQNQFETGDWVIYHKTKWSKDPGPRARNVTPQPGGDQYSYNIDKFWVVSETRDDGSIVLITRTGKRHVLNADLPSLKKANWLERFRFRSRFEAVEKMNQDQLEAQSVN